MRWLKTWFHVQSLESLQLHVLQRVACNNCLQQLHIQEALLLQRDRARHLSVEILQLQNISLENPIVWHYLRDSTFSRFDTIPECDRHTHTECMQTDRHSTTAYTALSIASRGKKKSTRLHGPPIIIRAYHCKQRATVDSKMYDYYHLFEQ